MGSRSAYCGDHFLVVLSVLSGLNKGIRRLSELNILICFFILCFTLVFGPTVFVLNTLIEQVGLYLQQLPRLMTQVETLGSPEWRSQWTILYFAWWIAWAPFVGAFIARISQGRTFRELVLGTLLLPTLLTCLWFVVFGGSAIHYQLEGLVNLEPFLKHEYSVLIFKFFEVFPFSTFIHILALVAVVLFFITSSDSASYIIHNMTNPKSKTFNKVYWAVLEGVAALILVFAGGIHTLELLVIITSFPFALFILVISYGFLRDLKKEYSTQ